LKLTTQKPRKNRKFDRIYDGPAAEGEYIGRDVENGSLFYTGYILGLPVKVGEVYNLAIQSRRDNRRMTGPPIKSRVLELRDDYILWEKL
jgi:hypothetical protein